MQAALFLITRAGIGIIFIAAAWGKILDPGAFAPAIDNYRILPAAAVMPAAVILPWVEMVTGVCLLTGRLTRGALLVVNALMLVFVSAFVVNLVRGIDVACGCFSLNLMHKKGTFYYLTRDAALLATGLWLLYSSHRSRRLQGPAGASR